MAAGLAASETPSQVREAGLALHCLQELADSSQTGAWQTAKIASRRGRGKHVSSCCELLQLEDSITKCWKGPTSASCGARLVFPNF